MHCVSVANPGGAGEGGGGGGGEGGEPPKELTSGLFIYFLVADTIWHKQGFFSFNKSLLSTYYLGHQPICLF